MAQADPFALFDAWMADARASEPNDPEAMAFASADADGRPSVRMVLLRSVSPDGFGFFTNLDSRKGAELLANPNGALAIHWKSLRRQVRAEGRVEQVSDAEADSYFASRSRESRIGSWASDQSRPLDSRAVFEIRYAQMQREFRGRGRARGPPRWSGFRLIPDADRILVRPAAPPARTATVHPLRRCLGRRAALPVSGVHGPGHAHGAERSALTTRAALASVAMALMLIGLKTWAAAETGSMAMLGSLADSGARPDRQPGRPARREDRRGPGRP